MNEISTTRFTVSGSTEVRAWIQSTGKKEQPRPMRRAGIPVLYLGGDARRSITNNEAVIDLTFYGYTDEDIVASIDRVATALEILRSGILEPHDLDERVPWQGEDAPKAATA